MTALTHPAATGDALLIVDTSSAIVAGAVLTIGSEEMLVRYVRPGRVGVDRGFRGTTRATHLTGSSVSVQIGEGGGGGGDSPFLPTEDQKAAMDAATIVNAPSGTNRFVDQADLDAIPLANIPTNDQAAAITAASTADGANPMATMGDLTALGDALAPVLPTPDEKAALDASPTTANAGNPYATVADLSGGGLTIPTIRQRKSGGAASFSAVLDAPPGDGHTLLMLIDLYTNGFAGTVTSDDTVWTRLVTRVDANARYELWAGVAGPTAGDTITITAAGTINCSWVVIEIDDAVTPTAGASLTTSGVIGIATIPTGHLVVLAAGVDDTSVSNFAQVFAPVPSVGVLRGPCALVVGYAAGPTYAAEIVTNGAGSTIVCEVT